MPSVKSFTMAYHSLNENGTFSEGDTVTGTVTLSLQKQITVQALFVKVKGDAEVRWTKKSDNRNHTYSAHRRYFKLKEFLIPENSEDTVVPQGIHVYKFSFAIPPGSMPASFRGIHGKIVYKIEAVLSRSWRMNSTVEKEIHFVSKSFPNLCSLMLQQVGSTNKEIGLFSKGHVHMDITLDKRAYAPGETMKIIAKINNSSSSEMTPKFSLIQDVVYRANANTKREETVIHRVVDNCMKPQTQKEVKCELKIPCNQMPTIQNCDIISVEYFLKAYLDISFSFDPEVMLPVIIFPPNLASGPQIAGPYPARGFSGPSNSDFLPQAGFIGVPSNHDFPPPAVSVGPYPAGGIGGPINSDFPPPPVCMDPSPASPYSGSYGYAGAQSYSAPPPPYPGYPPAGLPSVYPAQPAHISDGYSNPVPQLASPFGSPLSSSFVLHPPPSAPAFQPPLPTPEIHPSSSSPLSNISPTAPTYNLLPSSPMMNTDFLSQSNEVPPEYMPSFLASDSKNSDAK
ncbi:arrestin domain-containing protein 3-like [Channa argus]|uniref:arrestin domain-containing protein 3-like n=1 Tax=Channa argus TaxID=215402 RepID=UPI0035222601